MTNESISDHFTTESEDGCDQNGNSALLSQHLIESKATEDECIIAEGTSSELLCRGYKRDWFKSTLSICGVVCSVGFLLLIFYWRPDWKLKCTSSRTCMKSATAVLLLSTDDTNQVFVSTIKEMPVELALLLAGHYRGNDQLEHSYFDEEPNSEKTDEVSQSVMYFEHHLSKFIWNVAERTFVQLGGLDGIASLGQLHQNCIDGLSMKDIKMRTSLYGQNLITVEIPSYFKLMVSEILNPFYIFQLFAVIFWMFDDYYTYATAIFVVSIISAVVSLIEVRKERIRLRDMVQYHNETQSDVLRRDEEGLQQREIPSQNLVPGDVIIIPPGGMQLSCDAVLIAGTCIVNESMLTGESVPVTKTPLPCSSSEVRHIYNMQEHKRHTLFCGTEIVQTRFYRGDQVKAVVVSTGFHTAKGKLVHSILFPKPVDMKLLRDAYRFVGILFFMAMCGFIYTVIIMYYDGASVRDIALNALDLITISVPPALPLAMTVGIIYAQVRLRKQKIHCISPQRINVSGQIDVVAFDKTGTLTEDGLDLYALVPVSHNSSSSSHSSPSGFIPAIQPRNIIDDLGIDSELLHCMACCHTLTEIDGKLTGDPLDLKMFETTGFQLVEPQVEDEIKYDQLQTTFVRPTAGLLEKIKRYLNSSEVSTNQDENDEDSSVYDIGIVRQFPFSSSLQRSSVIAKPYRSKPRELVVYMKGAPETVVKLCRPESVPPDFQELLKFYSQQGFRMIGLAFKSLTSTWLKAQKIERQVVECDLVFLGLVALENKLKAQSVGALQKLNYANIRTLMVTGDNILTSLSVARESGMVGSHDVVFLAQTTPQTAREQATLTWIAVEENTEDNPASLTGSFASEEKMVKNNTVAICMGGQPSQSWHLAVCGESFAVIKDNFPEWMEVLAAKGTVFARMSPSQKTSLIEELQRIDYHVCMCGDGANDCGALKRAHAGLSLSEHEASVAAPFTSHTDLGIECVPTLMREGRAALVTSFGMFKFMALYSVIQFCSVTLLYKKNSNLGDMQYLYIDLIVIDLLALTMSRNHAYKRLEKHKPPSSLVSVDMLVSLIMQIILQCTAQVLIFCLVEQQCWYTNLSPKQVINETYGDNKTCHQLNNVPDQSHVEDGNNILTYTSSAIFLLSVFLYISVSVAFSRGRPFRTSVFRNWMFLLSLFALCVFSIFLVFWAPLELLDFFLIRAIPDTIFSAILLAVAGAHFLLAIAFEMLIVEQNALWDALRKLCGCCYRNHISKKYKVILHRLDTPCSYAEDSSVENGNEPRIEDLNPLFLVGKPFRSLVNNVDITPANNV